VWEHSAVAEYALDGALLWSAEFGADFDRRVHHDLVRQGSRTFVVNADAYAATDGRSYVMDGVYVFDADGELEAEWDLTELYDPAGEGGSPGGYWAAEFPGSIDWAHVNALWVDDDLNWTLSLHDFHTVIQVVGDPDAADFGALQWELVGDAAGGFTSDFTLTSSVPWVSPARFAGQHHTWMPEPGVLMLFDNNGMMPPEARALQIEIDEAARSAEITGAWSMGERCPGQSSAYLLPDGDVLGTCADSKTFRQMPEAGGEPSWTMTASCRTGSHRGPVYRGVPLSLD
jgi:hypothetical protein